MTSYQVGTQVAIQENATPGTAVQSVGVSGGTGSNQNLAAGTVAATVGSGVTEVDYATFFAAFFFFFFYFFFFFAAAAHVPYGP